jgi:predicted PurR-regulated permease PerM
MRSDLLVWVTRGTGLALGFAIVAGCIAVGFAAGGVLVVVFLSIVLAAALEPMVSWLRSRLPVGRMATILLVYAGFFAAVLGLARVILPAAFIQATDIAAGLPPLLDRVRDWAADIRPRGLGTSVTALADAVEHELRPAAPPADDVVRAGLSVVEAVISVATTLTIVFFWLLERARLQRYLLSFLPEHRRPGAREAWNAVEDRLGSWARGQLIIMGAMGLTTGAAYLLLGVPSALLLGLVAAVTEVIPIIGPILGAIPAVLVAATVSPELALVVGAVYVVIQFLEGAVLVPIVMRNSVGLSPFLVIVSLLVGAAAGGLPGALLAVPVAAALEVVVRRLQDREVPVAVDPAAIDAESAGDDGDVDEERDEKGRREKDALSPAS